MKPTFGQKATQALFALFDRAKLSGKPRALARENLAGDMADLLDEMAAKHRIQSKPKTLTQRVDEMDQIWIAELESEPALRGVDIRGALAEAQFWCRNNSRVCTRKFFTNWLLNPIHRRVLNPGGPNGRASANGKTAPAGWLVRLNEKYPESVYAKGASFEMTEETDYQWSRLPAEVRKTLQ